MRDVRALRPRLQLSYIRLRPTTEDNDQGLI
jgi:hypothetical protein